MFGLPGQAQVRTAVSACLSGATQLQPTLTCKCMSLIITGIAEIISHIRVQYLHTPVTGAYAASPSCAQKQNVESLVLS